MKILVVFILLINVAFSESLQSLLKEYEDISKNSLQTLNDKLGHATIYSQKELKAMQYDRLSDVLKELPITSLNKSAFGPNTLSLVGTKSETSGYFRLFINDHEVSSAYTQSPFLSWYELPISLIDYIEIYYGEGSFTLGSNTGVEFIRVYTKKAKKENGASLKTTITNRSTNSQEFSYSNILQNGWSYLLYFANQNSFFENRYNNNNLNNNISQQYFFLDLGDSKNSINLGFTRQKRDTYQGLSFDGASDDGDITNNNFYINYNRYFQKDNSLKLNLSVDIENSKYKEINKEGIGIVAVPGYLGRYIKEYSEDTKFTKLNATLSKSFQSEKNKFFTSIGIRQKKYKVKNRIINHTNKIGKLNNFDKETAFSFALQEDYKILNNLILIANYKADKYNRNGNLDNITKSLYRIGSIYLPNENLGFKTFYTISHIPPSFYNIDYAYTQKPDLDSQKFKYFTFEGAYSFGDKTRVSLEYFNVHMTDYIYNARPIGFINVDHIIKTNGFIFDYLYNIDNQTKIKFNYFISQLTETQNNYTDGGYLKYMKTYNKFSYFASLIYRKGFHYLGLDIPNSYNLNLGATYNISKDLSLSIKGTNLLNKSTQSILSDYTYGYSNPNLSLQDDYDREISLSLRWRF